MELLGTVWPFVPRGIERAAKWGGHWFDVSTPYLEFDGELPIAHVGRIDCRFAFDGEVRRVAALHGICVRESHRGAGHARRAIERALHDVDAASCERVILWSEKVDFYRRFGFEPEPESVFRLPAAAVKTANESVATRALALDRRTDLDLLQSALERRQPVSAQLSAADPGWHFYIDLALWLEATAAPSESLLIALPEDQAVLVGEVEDGVLRLYDVVAETPPPLPRILAAKASHSDQPIQTLETWFTPDRFDADFQPHPHRSEDILMVRGQPLLNGPAALSPMTRT